MVLLYLGVQQTWKPLTPNWCCQVYDNHSICLIILKSVKYTIYNATENIMYDNLTFWWHVLLVGFTLSFQLIS